MTAITLCQQTVITEPCEIQELAANMAILQGLLDVVCCLSNKLYEYQTLCEVDEVVSGNLFTFNIPTGYELTEDTLQVLWNGQRRYQVGKGTGLQWTYSLDTATQGTITFTEDVGTVDDPCHIAVIATLRKQLDCFTNC